LKYIRDLRYRYFQLHGAFSFRVGLWGQTPSIRENVFFVPFRDQRGFLFFGGLRLPGDKNVQKIIFVAGKGVFELWRRNDSKYNSVKKDV
jgi:hypothetical protein